MYLYAVLYISTTSGISLGQRLVLMEKDRQLACAAAFLYEDAYAIEIRIDILC